MLKKIVICLSLILWPLNLFLNFPKLNLSAETVFKNDYQGEQLVLRNIHLYPNVFMARVFQNKPRIYIYKIIDNFFVLTDPNNYFFGLHPEPLPGQSNIFKYPFWGIVFFFYGLFYISMYKYKKVVLYMLIPSIIFLMVLKSFEFLDITLWIPISLVIINGIERMSVDNKKLFTVISTLLIIFAIPEILRSFFNT